MNGAFTITGHLLKIVLGQRRNSKWPLRLSQASYYIGPVAGALRWVFGSHVPCFAVENRWWPASGSCCGRVVLPSRPPCVFLRTPMITTLVATYSIVCVCKVVCSTVTFCCATVVEFSRHQCRVLGLGAKHWGKQHLARFSINFP